MKAREIGKTSRSDIMGKMRDILESWISDIDLVDSITEETNLVTELGLDSIGILQVILGAESEFGISIENNELDSGLLSRMGNLISVIQEKLYENN